MLNSQKTKWIGLAVLLDILLTIAALGGARWLRGYFPGNVYLNHSLTLVFLDKPLHFPFFLLIPIIILIWMTVFSALSIYEEYAPPSPHSHAQQAAIAITGAVLIFAGVAYFIFPELSRFLFLYFYALDLLFLLGWRKIVSHLLQNEVYQQWLPAHRLLIVGDGAMAQKIGTAVLEHRWAGLELVGYANGMDGALGGVEETAVLVQQHQISEVVFALPPGHQQLLQELVYALQPLSINMRVVPDTADLIFVQTNIEDFVGVPMLNLRQPAIRPLARLIKRTFDIIFSSVLLLFSAPFLLPIIWFIKRSSPGPLLYSSLRVGENGRIFPMLKFRTMIEDADKSERDLLLKQEDGFHFDKRPNDPRVTGIGRFLRRSSLDEWPQLINVLKGEMSLIGPRPELPLLVEKYKPWQYQRLTVPQGMTGWWQVKNRDKQQAYNLRIEDDLYYIHNHSFFLDLRILWLTIGATVRGDGAY